MSQEETGREVGEAQVIAVISGKGGVGKSVFCVNFSIALGQLGQRVLLIDLDIGFGNVEQMMNCTSSGNITDWLDGSRSISEVAEKGPGHIRFISGGSGLTHVFQLDDERRSCFLQQMEQLKHEFDWIIFDFGAGISETLIHLILAAHSIFLVTTPEVPAMTDGYSAIKLLKERSRELSVSCIVNQVGDAREGRETWRRLAETAKRFLDTDIRWLSAFHRDPDIVRSVKAQVPVLILRPDALFSREMRRLARQFLAEKADEPDVPRFSSFIGKIIRAFRERRG